ncbi:MAG TPA: DUF3224 domain-containing protein [Holophagaceae bacterium]|jgi:hypothetical protein|nr:DUF3224 domain-containing protein [Holophagaceae bacterium]
MSIRATAACKGLSWDETPHDEAPGEPKLTTVHARNRYSGDWEGEGILCLLMAYVGDQAVHYTGLERVTGSLDSKKGSFLLKHDGIFEDGLAKTTWTVVPGSGTDELAGLRGKGGFASGHAEESPVTLEYEFA